MDRRTKIISIHNLSSGYTHGILSMKRERKKNIYTTFTFTFGIGYQVEIRFVHRYVRGKRCEVVLKTRTK